MAAEELGALEEEIEMLAVGDTEVAADTRMMFLKKWLALLPNGRMPEPNRILLSSIS